MIAAILLGFVIVFSIIQHSAMHALSSGAGVVRLFLRAALGGLEVYGIWVLAVQYPRLIEDARLQALESERSRQAAEIAQLREHLQPHFLRNTLNAISALVSQDPGQARELLAALADLLSDSLEDTAPRRTLAAEMAWLRRYAEILEVRYRGSLRFTWDEQASASTKLVPRLLFQPLVENAIHHGALARDSQGSVTVRTRTTATGGTRVEVEDNGPGFDLTQSTDGVGLTLVRGRVALEAHGSFQIQSKPTGTLAIVVLP